MRSNYGTRSANERPTFEAFSFRIRSAPMPLDLHVRRWTADGAVASLLVYAPTRGDWFEGDDMPADVRAFALDALAVRLGYAPVFAYAAGVRS